MDIWCLRITFNLLSSDSSICCLLSGWCVGFICIQLPFQTGGLHFPQLICVPTRSFSMANPKPNHWWLLQFSISMHVLWCPLPLQLLLAMVFSGSPLTTVFSFTYPEASSSGNTHVHIHHVWLNSVVTSINDTQSSIRKLKRGLQNHYNQTIWQPPSNHCSEFTVTISLQQSTIKRGNQFHDSSVSVPIDL